jgi:hypothetical protein
MSKTNRLRAFAIVLTLLCGSTAHAELIGQATSYPNSNYFDGHVGEPGFGVFADSALSDFCCHTVFVAPGSYLIQDGAHRAWGFLDSDGTHFTCPSPNDLYGDCSAGILIFYTLTLPDIAAPLFETIILTAPLTVDAWVGF